METSLRRHLYGQHPGRNSSRTAGHYVEAQTETINHGLTSSCSCSPSILSAFRFAFPPPATLRVDDEVRIELATISSRSSVAVQPVGLGRLGSRDVRMFYVQSCTALLPCIEYT